MDELKVLEYRDIRVLTTKQLAEAYGTSSKQISQAFNKNKDRYMEGKHYFGLIGDDKRDFLNRLQIADTSSRARIFYLWTERGTLLLAKSINTDIAWEAYERLVDFYFDIKKAKESKINESIHKMHEVSNTPVPKLTGWYAKNKRIINNICECYGCDRKVLYHFILSKLSEEYDLEAANEIYEKERGYYPEYAMDIVEYFPQLAEKANEYLGRLIRLYQIE